MSCIETNIASFIARLNTLEGASKPKSNLLIDENLNTVQKSGFWWSLLCLIRPFYALLGKDPYSHVRISRVADNIYKYCKANENFLLEQPGLRTKIQESIFQNLETRVSKKDFSVYRAAIATLGIKKPKCVVMEIQTSHRLWPSALWEGMRLPQNSDAKLILMALLQSQASHAADMLRQVNKLLAYGFQVHCDFAKKKDKSRWLQISILAADFSEATSLQVQVPHSLILFQQQNKVSNLLLLTKNVIASGSERKVKLCYEVITGKYFVRKRAIEGTSFELSLMKHFIKNPSRGIAKISYLVPKTSKSPSTGKTLIIQPLYDLTIAELFGSDELKQFEQKIILIQDLLAGLFALHAISQHVDLSDPPRSPIALMFHSDLKPGNILVRREGGSPLWRAGITDFGSADLFMVRGSPGYLAPERAELILKENPTKKDVVAHHLTYGQAMDIWSMGLILIDIMTLKPTYFSSKGKPVFLSQLECIHRCIFEDKQSAETEPNQREKLEHFTRFANLKQKDIDTSIEALLAKQEPLDPAESTIWDLIRQMVRIDPTERISAKEALRILSLV